MKILNKKNYSILILAFLFNACASSVDPVIDMKPPAYVEQLPSKISDTNVNQGSLFGRGQNPLFGDRKAMNVNDIVTIVISENTSQTTSSTKKTNKDGSTSLNGGVFGANGALSNLADKINNVTDISFKAGSKSDFSGSGSNNRKDNFTSTITARIVKVLNNGNYFIQGSRELLINGEKQIIEISGVIRPYDISQNNEINSKYIADAKILYKTQGEIERSTRKPWGRKVLESIWPF